MDKLTSNNFNKQCGQVFKNARGVAAQIQTLLVFAIAYYMETGHDARYLTKIRRDAEAYKGSGISINKLDGYIRHMVNVKWAEAKDGKMVYVRNGKLAELNGEPQFTTWKEFTRSSTQDVRAQTEAAFIKYIETRANPEDAAKYAPEVVQLAKDFLEMLDERQRKAA